MWRASDEIMSVQRLPEAADRTRKRCTYIHNNIILGIISDRRYYNLHIRGVATDTHLLVINHTNLTI